MYHFRFEPTDDRVGLAFTNALGTQGTLSLGGAHGSTGPAPGIAEVAHDLGLDLALIRQVHGAGVVEATRDNLADLPGTEADALVTTHRGIGLTVRVADCLPVLFADQRSGVIGAAHAGRVGLAAGVLQATVARLRELGADRIEAWIGPHVCGSCYEVPEQLAADVSAVVPNARSTTRQGTPGLDLAAGAVAILTELGVSVVTVDGCTLERADLHSYRRDAGASGRQAGIVWLAG